MDEEGLPVSYHDRRIQPASPASSVVKPAVQAEDEELEAAMGPERIGVRPVQRKYSPGQVILSTSPSLWGLMGNFVTAVLFFVIAGFLLFYPIGSLVEKLIPEATKWTGTIDRVTRYIGMGLGALVFFWLLFHIAQLKSIRYEVSTDRIEFTRGIFDRKIDNLDMYRIVDLKLHRSLLDCLLGIGSVGLVTKDDTDPIFEFEKVADPKKLYDVIKQASLAADRKQGVIHID